MNPRAVATAAMMLILGACMPPAPQLDLPTIRSLTITDVSVEASYVNDTDSEIAVIKASGRDPNLVDSSEYLKSPEGRKQVQDHVAGIVKSEFTRVAASTLTGTAKARLVVKVISFDVPGAVRRVLIGGSYEAYATISLVDLSTGRTLATSPALRASLVAGTGILNVPVEALGTVLLQARPVDVRLSEALAKAYFDWLLQKR